MAPVVTSTYRTCSMALFPAPSVILYLRVYEPVYDVSINPEEVGHIIHDAVTPVILIIAGPEPLLGSLSVQFTSGRILDPFIIIVIVGEPLNAISGGVVSMKKSRRLSVLLGPSHQPSSTETVHPETLPSEPVLNTIVLLPTIAELKSDVQGQP